MNKQLLFLICFCTIEIKIDLYFVLVIISPSHLPLFATVVIFPRQMWMFLLMQEMKLETFALVCTCTRYLLLLIILSWCSYCIERMLVWFVVKSWIAATYLVFGSEKKNLSPSMAHSSTVPNNRGLHPAKSVPVLLFESRVWRDLLLSLAEWFGGNENKYSDQRCSKF